MMKHIRIVSPSGAIDPAYIDGAVARLSSWGYVVSEGRYARSKYGRFAGTDSERTEDVCSALGDPAVDVVLCARGGYGLQRIIDRIAPVYTRCPKPIIGFSDITCLHQLAALHATPSLHGLMCKHIATLPEEAEALRLFRGALGGGFAYSLPAHAANRCGVAEGVLVGGNLSVLYGLQGTPYSLSAVCQRIEESRSGAKPILFVEDIAERHYHIDRMMNNLRLSCVWQHVAGLVVGQFSDCEDDPSMGCTVYDTIRQSVEGYSFPVLFNFPAGHVDYNLPLWFGVPVTLNVGPDTCTLLSY